MKLLMIAIAAIVVTFPAQASCNIEIAADKLTYLPGEVCEIRGFVWEDGEPVRNVSIYIYDSILGSALGYSTPLKQIVFTDETGCFVYSLQIPERLKAGTYEIKAEYKDASNSITIRVLELTTTSTGYIYVWSYPGGAKVYVDGQYKGTTGNDWLKLEVSAGKHEVGA